MVGRRVRKRRCLGEGPMAGWLWQPGRGTTKVYNTPTPQIGADRCMQKSLPVGTFLNRSFPSIGRGLNRSVLATIRPTTMTLSTRCSLTVRSFWKFISKNWKFSFEEQRTSNGVSISLRTTARLIDKRHGKTIRKAGNFFNERKYKSL